MRLSKYRHYTMCRKISKRVSSLVAEKGMSVADVAQQAQVSRSWLYKVMAGEIVPGTVLLQRLAETLDTTSEEILE